MRHIVASDKKRVPFRYFGGKNRLTRFILPYLNFGEIYVEPYCGAGNVFWAKNPHGVEVLNDIDHDIVNIYRVLQDPAKFKVLAHKLWFTPYSKAEYDRAIQLYYSSTDDVERAWAYLTVIGQGMSGFPPGTRVAWARSFMSRGGCAQVANSWRGRWSFLRWWHNRLSGVILECADAIGVIEYWDTEKTVFYIDPPYPHDTRADENVYKHEMSNEQHVALVDKLVALKGQCVVSSYPNAIYDKLIKSGWKAFDIVTHLHAASTQIRPPRVERLYITPLLASLVCDDDLPLFRNEEIL